MLSAKSGRSQYGRKKGDLDGRPSRDDLLADLAAYRVFLLIQGTLLLLGDVPAVLARHVALFVPDLTVFLVQLVRLRRRELAFLHVPVDALVLMRQPIVDFGSTRMMFLPIRFREGAGRTPTTSALSAASATALQRPFVNMLKLLWLEPNDGRIVARLA